MIALHNTNQIKEQYALHTVLSVKYEANTPKKFDLFPKVDFLSPKQLLRRNNSQVFINAEFARLNDSIETYKKKIAKRQKDRKVLSKKSSFLQGVPRACQQIKCSLEEKPVCAKLSYKDGKHKPFYVNVINPCELKYFKCRQGLEATVVPLTNCHSILDMPQLPELQFQKPTNTTAHKRSKRGIKSAPPKEAPKAIRSKSKPKVTVKPKKINLKAGEIIAKSIKTTLKPIVDNKTTALPKKVDLKASAPTKVNLKSDEITDNSQSETKFSSPNKTTVLSKKVALKAKPKSLLPADKTKAVISKVDLKAEIEETVDAQPISKTKSISTNKTNPKTIPTKDILKSGATKNIMPKNFKNMEKTNLKAASKKKARDIKKPVRNIKIGKAKAVGNKQILKNVKARKPIGRKDKILRAGKEDSQKYSEESMVDHGTFKTKPAEGKEDSQEYSEESMVDHGTFKTKPAAGKQYFVKNTGQDKMFDHDIFKDESAKEDLQNTNYDDGRDDPYIDEHEQDTKSDKPDEKNNENEENIEITMEIDDSDLDKVMGGNLKDANHSELGQASFADAPDTQDGEDLNDQKPEFEQGEENRDQDDYIEGEVIIDDDEDPQENMKEKGENIENETDASPTQNVQAGINNDGGAIPLQNFNAHAPDAIGNDPSLPLVVEPKVADNKLNEEPASDDYVYQPDAAHIVPLPDKDEDDENNNNENENNGAQEEVPPNNEPNDSMGDGIQNVLPSDKEDVNVLSAEMTDDNGINDDNEKIPYAPSSNPEADVENSDVDYDTPLKDEIADKEEMNAECPRHCPSRDMMVCAKCNHGIYRTFLSVCHMRMYQCQGPNNNEKLELIARYPCALSAPIITDEPPMQPRGHVSDPGDDDPVLRYVRCREKDLLGKDPKCAFDESKTSLNLENTVGNNTGNNEAEVSPFEY